MEIAKDVDCPKPGSSAEQTQALPVSSPKQRRLSDEIDKLRLEVDQLKTRSGTFVESVHTR